MSTNSEKSFAIHNSKLHNWIKCSLFPDVVTLVKYGTKFKYMAWFKNSDWGLFRCWNVMINHLEK